MKTESKYLYQLTKNRNNTVISFGNKEVALRSIISICNRYEDIGYLVIEDFCVSQEISSHINFRQDLAFLISKKKINEIYRKHKVQATDLLCAIEKASSDPITTIYDNNISRYQFLVNVNADGYRVCLELNTIPLGIRNVKANIAMTVFKESKYRKRIEAIKKGNNKNLSLLFEAGEGWTALVTQSPSRVFVAVASASEESSSASLDIITKNEQKHRRN